MMSARAQDPVIPGMLLIEFLPLDGRQESVYVRNIGEQNAVSP
jgi:hypothetical protein